MPSILSRNVRPVLLVLCAGGLAACSGSEDPGAGATPAAADGAGRPRAAGQAAPGAPGAGKAREGEAGKGANAALLAYQTARSLLLKGSPEKAREEFERAVELDPGMAVAHFELGKLLVHLSSQNVGSASRDHDILDEGIAALHKAFELEPRNDEHAYWLGRAYHLKDDAEEAMDYLRQALALNPESGAAWRRLGIIQLEDADSPKEQAKESFLKAIECDPRDAGAHFQLAQTLELLDDETGARQEYKLATEHDRTQPEPYGSLARLLAKAGDEEGAKQAQADFDRWSNYDKELKRRMVAVNQNPVDAKALLALGEMYYAVEKWQDALEWFLKSLNIDSKNALAHLYCGIVRRELQDYEQATHHLKESEFLEPDSLEPKLELVRLYAAMQDEKSLSEVVAKVETEGAQDMEALRRMAEVCRETGRDADAQRLTEKVQALEAGAPAGAADGDGGD